MKPALLIVILTGILLPGCNESEQPEGNIEITEFNLPDQVLHDSETYLTKAGRRTTTISYDTLKAFQAKDTTLMYGLEVSFFDSTGSLAMTLTADSGIVTRESTILEAKGNVLAWTDDGRRLVTDSLSWNSESGKVTTEGYVEAYRGANKISGWGLETDQHLENVVIKHDPKGSFVDPQSENN
jgi:LPS export ABC transporter protein LptC